MLQTGRGNEVDDRQEGNGLLKYEFRGNGYTVPGTQYYEPQLVTPKQRNVVSAIEESQRTAMPVQQIINTRKAVRRA